MYTYISPVIQSINKVHLNQFVPQNLYHFAYPKDACREVFVLLPRGGNRRTDNIDGHVQHGVARKRLRDSCDGRPVCVYANPAERTPAVQHPA